MRRFYGSLLLIVLLVLAGTSAAHSDSFFIYEQYGGAWQDANKTVANPEDDLMCWAAAASNLLAWGHWGTAIYNNTDAIFDHFQDHWTDNGGYMSWAWKWWFNGSPPPYTFASYPDVPGGGNFYPTLNFSVYYKAVTGVNYMETIDTWLHQGWGIGLILGGPGSHAVTAWGFGYSSPGVYTSIFITDSDDNYLGLREYPLIWQNNAWYLGGGYSGWKISGIQSLQYHHTPIAPSWLLFGTGVGSLFLLRRRRQRPENQDSRSR